MLPPLPTTTPSSPWRTGVPQDVSQNKPLYGASCQVLSHSHENMASTASSCPHGSHALLAYLTANSNTASTSSDPVSISPLHTQICLVCSDCHNKIPQSRWLKNPNCTFSQLWRLKSPKPRCQQVPGEALFLACRWSSSYCVLIMAFLQCVHTETFSPSTATNPIN